jgi:hypothetical protein
MRDVAQATIDKIIIRESIQWQPNAGIEEEEEYFSVNVADLPSPRRPGRATREDSISDEEATGEPPDPYLTEAAALLRIVLAPGELDNLHPAQLEGGNFRFYAIVWERGNGGLPVAFVSEYNPVQILRKAKYFFRYDGTLRLTAVPDFTLDQQGDLIVTPDEIAILNNAVFDHLFSDIRALLNDVPVNVVALQQTFSLLPFSSESVKALEAVCATRPRLAARLQQLARCEYAQDINLAILHRALKNHGEEPTDFIRNSRVEITRNEVGPFLDVLEGRWYEADFTSEPRRAASWSPRKPRRPQETKPTTLDNSS